jgi:hypothetical protein
MQPKPPDAELQIHFSKNCDRIFGSGHTSTFTYYRGFIARSGLEIYNAKNYSVALRVGQTLRDGLIMVEVFSPLT